MYMANSNDDTGEIVLLDLTPKKIYNMNQLNGHQQPQLDDFTSPTNLILNKTPLNNREHAADDEFTSTFI